MQKNFTQLIAHFLSTKRYTVPAGAFLLFLATSLYVWATIFPAPVNRSATVDQAADAVSPSFVSIPNYVIKEESGSDFATTSLVIKTNGNWRFNSNSATTVALSSSGGNINSGRIIRPALSTDFKTLTFTISYNNSGNNREDITISGMEVQPISGAVALPSAGTIYIEANANVVGLSSNKTVANLTMTHGAAKQVAFTTQPGSALINEALDPQPVVAIQDQFGNTVTSATSQVSLVIGTNPPGNGVLNGTTTVNAVGGVATFSGLNIDKAGTGYTLIASSGALTTATSTAFTVNNPQPTISSISPCLTAGDPETTITITGSNFIPGATVLVNTVSRAATVVNSTTLTTTLTEAELASAGNRSVVVKNPTPAQNNGESDPFTLKVLSLISPNIGGVSSVCVNQTAGFSTSLQEGVRYEWAVVSGDASITRGEDTYSIRVDFGSTAGTVEISLIAYNECNDPGPATTKTITVNPLPTAELTAPEGTTACAGNTVALEATPVEGATYQWLLNGSAVTNYIADNTYAAGASGKYRVRVKSSAGCTATSGEVAVTIYALPTATIAEGATVTYCAGSTTTLTAQESGTGYTYQWYVGGAPIANETERTLTVGAEGTYTVEVTRNGCSTMSEPTTVTELPLPTAEITPRSATEFCAGGSVILDATPGTGYTYKWFAESDPTVVLETVASFQTSIPGKYYVEVTGANGCVANSASVAVVVNQPPVATIEATGPAEFCAGQSVVLNAPAAPFGSTYAYEWYLDGGTTAIGTNQSIEASESGTYTVKVTNTATGCESTSAGTVVKEGTLEFAIFTYTGATEFCEGGSLQLDAILPPEGQTYAYRWFNGEGTTVATTRSYTVTTTGTYQVEITETSIENDCVKTSDPLQVTVDPQPTASIDGASQSLCAEADGTTSFSVSGTFSGGTALWSSNNTNFVIQDAVYNAETGIATANVVASGSGDATISLTTSSTVTGCNQAADAVVLNVKPLPTATITAQGPTTFCQGGEVILNASEGTGYTYQWYLNGEPVIGTGSSYTASLAGNYYVQVTNNGCMVQSEPVAVTVNPLPTATIEADGAIVFCEGGSVTLNAVSDIGTSFTWYNGTTQVGTGQTFVADVSGSYTVLVEAGTGCTNTSAATEVTVNSTPDATITALGETTFCERESVTLQAPAAPEGQTYDYQWFSGANQITGATDQMYQAIESGNYTVRVTNTSTSLNCSATTSEPVAVTVNPLPTASISFTGSTTFCQGSSLLLTGNSDTGTSFIWYKDNVQVATTPTYSATTTGSYTVRATNGNNCTSDLSAAVQVTVNPTITGNSIASNQTVCSGGTIAALGQASGTTLSGGIAPNNTYQWEQRIGTSGAWTEISGATAASYTPPVQTVTTATTFYYRRIVSGGGCSNTSDPVSVTVNPLTPVSISGVTDGATYYTGQNSIALAGSPTGGTFTGPGVSGTVSAGFTFSPCTAGVGAHTITYTYKNSAGCTSTAQARVNVVQSKYRAIITANPHPFCQGTNVTYTATVYRDFAESDIIYPYLVNANGQPVDKAGNLIDTGAGKFPVANDQYPFPENTPESIKLLAYRFFQPIVKAGVPTVDLSGEAYQWMKNDKNERKNDQSTTTDAGLSSQDYYSVRVEGSQCNTSLVLNSNRMYSAEIPGYTATLAANPNPVCQGGTVTFTATLGTFDWATANTTFELMLTRSNTNYSLGSVPYSGSSTVEFVTDAAVAGGFVSGDQVFLRFTSDVDAYQASTKCAGTNVSAPVTITVNQPVAIAPQSQDQTVCVGGSATFSANATGTDLNYQWYRGTTPVGTNSATLNIPSAQLTDAGQYSVKVWNSCTPDGVTVVIGNLTVDEPATISAQPSDVTVCEGESATFSVTAAGKDIVYQWLKDGVEIGGAIASSYTIPSTTDIDAGDYSVRITGTIACGSITSDVASLTIDQPVEASAAQAGTHCEGSDVTLSVDATGAGLNYQWYYGTTPVGTNNSTLTIPNADVEDSGEYSVVVTGTCTPEGVTVNLGTLTVKPNILALGDLLAKDDEGTITEENPIDVGGYVTYTAVTDYEENDVESYTWYVSTDGTNWTVQSSRTNQLTVDPVPNADLYVRAEVVALETACYQNYQIILETGKIVPLPVEIIYLNASKQGNNVVLEWATAMEQDNKGFEVQVSTDGFNYRLLTFVPSKNGNTSMKQVYTFTDKENGKHGTRYYRLKQLDNSGTFEFFGPKAVTFGSVASKIVAFPNPFHDEVTLDIASEKSGQMLIVVTDAVGKQLMQRTVEVEQGFTTEKLKLDANLPRGMYIIKTHIGGETQYIKLIKE
jgi:hypothetical protein